MNHIYNLAAVTIENLEIMVNTLIERTYLWCMLVCSKVRFHASQLFTCYISCMHTIGITTLI